MRINERLVDRSSCSHSASDYDVDAQGDLGYPSSNPTDIGRKHKGYHRNRKPLAAEKKQWKLAKSPLS